MLRRYLMVLDRLAFSGRASFSTAPSRPAREWGATAAVVLAPVLRRTRQGITGGIVGLCFVVGMVGRCDPPRALETEYRIRRWTRDDGLPHDLVHAVAQTADGYVWIGTKGGLARFDGTKFTVFNRSNTAAMQSEEIIALMPASPNELYVGLGRRCPILVRRNSSWGRMEICLFRPCPQLMARGADGSIWIQGYDGTGLEWQNHRAGVLQAKANLDDRAPLAMYHSPDGDLWFASRERLERVPAGDWSRLVSYPLPPIRHAAWGSAAFARGPDGHPWFLYGDGLQEQSFSLLRAGPDGPERVCGPLAHYGGRPVFLTADRQGRLWFPGNPNRIERYEAGQRTEFATGLGTNDCAQCLAEDGEGNLWLGTAFSGVFCLTPRTVMAWGVDQGLPHANVRTVCPAGERQAWAGTEKGLLQVGADGALKTVAATAGMSVRALAAETSGRLWMGTLRGLFQLESDQLTPVVLPVRIQESEDRESLGSGKVRGLCLSPQGDLWVAAADVLSVFPHSDRLPRAIADMKAREFGAVLADRIGNVWFAADTYGVGVFRRDQVEAEVQRESTRSDLQVLRPEGSAIRCRTAPNAWLSVANGLSDNHPLEILEDTQGTVWIACETGLNRVPADLVRDLTGNARPPSPAPVLRRPFVFNRTHGLPDQKVLSLLEDGQTNLWCGSDSGVFRVALAELAAVAEGRSSTLHVALLTESHGLPSRESSGLVSRPSSARTPDGRLWFATVRGVASFDEREILARRAAPPVIIEQVRADDEIVFSEFSGLLSTNASLAAQPPARPASGPTSKGRTPALRLPAGRARVIDFSFTAAKFEAPKECRLRYQLAGYETAWHEAGDRRQAFYTSLAPRDYCFRVESADAEGVWSGASVEFAFVLAPFFWQTAWFKVGVVLAGIGLVVLVIRWRAGEARRVEQIERQNALLRERSTIAQDIHDDLSPRLAQLALLSEPQRADRDHTPSGDLADRQHLATLARDLALTMDSTLWAVEPSGDTFASFIDYVTDYATDVVATTGHRLQFDFPKPVPDRPLPPRVKRHLVLGLRDLLRRAIHQPGANTVTVGARLEDGHVVVEVAHGAAPSALVPLLPAMKSASPLDERPPAHRLGLQALEARTKEVGGNIKIQGPGDTGTTVALCVPLPDTDAGEP